MVCPRIKNAILAKKLSNARPLPFSHGGKRKQNRRRGSPGPQVILSVLFSGEPPRRYHKNQRYNKGLRPRVFGPLYCFSPAPNRSTGPLAPFLYGLVLAVWFESISLKRKSTKSPGGSGGSPPDASFPPFFAERKGGHKAQAVLYGGMSVYKREPIRCRLRIGSYSA